MSQSEKINKLVFEGTPEAFEYLQNLWKSGTLNDLLHISVINVRVVSQSQFCVWENLSQWFDNIFGESWQPVMAFRKINSLKTSPVTRFKVINLEDKAVKLVINLKRAEAQKTDIIVQIEPDKMQMYLPKGLQMMVIDESGNIFSETKAESRDERIQQRFRCSPDTKFSIKVILGDVSTTENYIVDSMEKEKENYVVDSMEKEKCDREMTQKYELELKALEEKYQAIINNKDKINISKIEPNLVWLSEWFDGWFTGEWKSEKSEQKLAIKENFSSLHPDSISTELQEVRGYRVIKLGKQKQEREVFLRVRQKQTTEDKVNICLELYPANDSTYLGFAE